MQPNRVYLGGWFIQKTSRHGRRHFDEKWRLSAIRVEYYSKSYLVFGESKNWKDRIAGLVRTLGKRVYRKVSRVRIPLLPPIFRIRILGDFCLAPPKAGLGFGKDFEGIFEIQKQFLPAQTEVRFAEGKHKFEKFINQSFFFRQRRKAKR